jgi:hypothetical protein
MQFLAHAATLLNQAIDMFTCGMTGCGRLTTLGQPVGATRLLKTINAVYITFLSSCLQVLGAKIVPQ